MTLQVDDAGWGSLIGPVLIGVYRVETAEFAYREIPVECFQGSAFARQEYLAAAVQAAQDAFVELRATPQEEVEACTGYVLQGVRDWLRREGYAVEETAIRGPLQILVEMALAQVLQQIGFLVDPAVLRENHGRAFFEALKWLKGGNLDATRALPGRERWAKTGWNSYRTWIDHPYEQARQLARQRKRPRCRLEPAYCRR